MHKTPNKKSIEIKVVSLILIKHGFLPIRLLAEIISAILCKLKKGVQLYQLPFKDLFEGLFLNAYAGFDGTNVRASFNDKEINANIYLNRRIENTEDWDEYFDQDLYNERYAVEQPSTLFDSSIKNVRKEKSQNFKSRY